MLVAAVVVDDAVHVELGPERRCRSSAERPGIPDAEDPTIGFDVSADKVAAYRNRHARPAK